MVPFISHCERITGIFFALIRIKCQLSDRISSFTAVRIRAILNKGTALPEYIPVFANEQGSLINFIPDLHAGLANVKISPLVIHFLAADPERDPCINMFDSVIIQCLAVKGYLMRLTVVAPAVSLRDGIVKTAVFVIFSLAYFRYKFEIQAVELRQVEPECPGSVRIDRIVSFDVIMEIIVFAVKPILSVRNPFALIISHDPERTVISAPPCDRKCSVPVILDLISVFIIYLRLKFDLVTGQNIVFRTAFSGIFAKLGRERK